MPLFGKSKTPRELVNAVNEQLAVSSNANKSDRDRKRAMEEVLRLMQLIKQMLTERANPSESRPNELESERIRINEVLSDISSEMFATNTLPVLLDELHKFDFEGSKFVESLFAQLMSRKVGNCHMPAVDYMLKHADLLFKLLSGYERPDQALLFGGMLREACRHERIAELVLLNERFYDLFRHVHGTAFDVSSDAFQTLKDLLTRHKLLVAQFLEKQFDVFFEHYRSLIESDNYVTKRQALKTLGELLLDRYNYNVMTKYIASAENLKLIMNVLKSRQKQIAFEAFHCFKVFVANPNKPRPVHNILYQNKERLVDFLVSFQTERADDNQFTEEKAYLVKQIQDMLPAPPAEPSTGATT